MANVATRLRTFLLASTDIAAAVANRVHYAYVPEDTPRPFIYLTRTGVREERCLGESGGVPFSHTFAVECVTYSLDESQSLAALVYARCDGFIGTFADTTTKGIFVDAQDDDYLSQFGEHVAALSVEVVP